MPVNGIELKEGQKWKTLYGGVVTLQDSPRGRSYIFRTVYEDGEWDTVTKDGKRWTSDYDSFLRELIDDPEQQVKEKLIMKFNPKPGDKIICNDGEEFICCTLEFLRETIYEGIKSDKPILGYRKFGYEEAWMDWDEEAFSYPEEYGIREVIPQNSEVTDDKKEEVKEDSLYTVDEVFDAIFEVTKHLEIEVPWGYIDDVKEHLSRKNDPQYQEYLRLKAIYG